jgi:hypothetical protein
VLGSRLYVLGGFNGTVLDGIESAPIRTDGPLGSFSHHARDLKQPVVAPVMTIPGNTLNLIGSDLSSVEAAGVVAGELTSFADAPTRALNLPRTGFASALLGNALFVVGGQDASGVGLADIQRAGLR